MLVRSSASALLLLLLLVGSGCFVRRPEAKKGNIIETPAGYVEVKQPYFKKHVNGLGALINIGFVGAGGYYGYGYQKADATKQYLYAAGGAAAGYLFSRLLFAIGGNHRKTYVQSPVELEQWVAARNRWKAADWRLTGNPAATAESMRLLPGAREAVFQPGNLNDVKNFAAVFPSSVRLPDVIDSAKGKLPKPDLREMITLFPTSPNILFSKVEYINRSASAAELVESLKLYPEAEKEKSVEARYAGLVRSFPFAQDFIHRYPHSSFSTQVFSRMYGSLARNELEELIDAYPRIDPQVLQQARRRFYEQFVSFDELREKVTKYNDSSYLVKPGDTYADLESAYALYQRMQTEAGRESFAHGTELIGDMKVRLLSEQLSDARGSYEDTRGLFKLVRETEWLKDDRTDSIIERIIQANCMLFKEEYFTGKKVNELVQGPGTLYRSNGNVLSGNFIKGKLSGPGRLRRPDGELQEGVFVDNELNGEGRITAANGRVVAGTFRNGNLTGAGSVTFPDGRKEQGAYRMNRLEGQGERTYADGDRYSGEFRDGFPDGTGSYEWKDGLRFEGAFAEGKREGDGSLLLPGGYVAKGVWKKDCPDGVLTVTHASGYEAQFTFSNCRPTGKKLVSGAGAVDEKDLIRKINEF